MQDGAARLVTRAGAMDDQVLAAAFATVYVTEMRHHNAVRRACQVTRRKDAKG